MRIEELKTAWTEYDRKLHSTHIISEKIILSMIRERSRSRISWLEKIYIISFICNSLWVTLSAIVILTNPLGFTAVWQHIPTMIMNLSLIVLLVISIKSYREMKAVDINHSNLDISLKSIIHSFEKPWKYLKWNIFAIMLSAFLFPLSFLPASIESIGLWPAITFQVTGMCIVAVVYLISVKYGAFKERYGNKFREDLRELTEMKAMSYELTQD